MCAYLEPLNNNDELISEFIHLATNYESQGFTKANETPIIPASTTGKKDIYHITIFVNGKCLSDTGPKPYRGTV